MLALLPALAALVPAAAYAANIYVYDPTAVGRDDLASDELNGSIIIDGQIEDGDYEKFIEAVADAGSYKGHVFISSRGGNVGAAIGIGNLIRALRFTTEVPMQSSRGGGHCLSEVLSECTCASACVLVYLGGVEREGNLLAIHRTFIRHDELEDLSFGEAALAGRLQARAVDEYLRSMGVPLAFSELMRSIPSSEVQVLSVDFVERYLEELPEIEEWIAARCGDEDAILERRRRQGLDPYEGDWLEYVTCARGTMEFARAEVFYAALSAGIDVANPQLMPEELRVFSTSRDFDLVQILGRSVNDIDAQLKWIGLGGPNHRAPTGVTKNGPDNYAVAIGTTGEADPTVSVVSINLGTYRGPIIDGATVNEITFEWLRQRLGEPSDGVVMADDTGIALFEPLGGSFIAVVTADVETLQLHSLELCQSRTSAECSASLYFP